ncbi:MAG: aspartate aminotransferase family protein [Actinobacteria bacterium]|nr:aspartate aminotransferase family protein [Actinomycetota bacterium]
MDFDATQVALWRERTPTSKELWERTKELIPTGHGGGMGYFVPHPIVVDHAKGSKLWDVDGNEYVDLRIGDWVLIHGHCDERIAAAIDAQLERSVQIGAPEWDAAYRLAELLGERTPSIDKVRFFASGTDANLSAIRLARVHTGRTKVAKAAGAYHGTADVLVVGTSTLRDPADQVPIGVPAHAADEVVEIPFNDPDGAAAILEREGADLAAVLIEPVLTTAGMIPATSEFLQRLREVTERLGIVLVFDEVVTYPAAFGGGQAHYDMTPDLTTLAKVIGGGIPCSAVGGRREIMDLLEPDAHGGEAPLSIMSTFGGNQIAMAAGAECLRLLTPAAHERMARLGDRARDGINALGARYGIPLQATGLGHLIGLHWTDVPVVDLPSRMTGDREKVANLILALDNLGYYQTFTGVFFLSTVIDEAEVDGFLAALEQALHRLGYVDGGDAGTPDQAPIEVGGK